MEKLIYNDEYTGPRYRYGLYYRPLSTGTVPRGFIINSDREHSVFRHGTIDYPKQLTEQQISDYELTYICKFVNGAPEPEEGHYMSYSQIYDLMSLYSSHKTLELFADSWERFPVEPIVSVIIEQLGSDRLFWLERKPDISIAFEKAIKEIRIRLK